MLLNILIKQLLSFIINFTFINHKVSESILYKDSDWIGDNSKSILNRYTNQFQIIDLLLGF